MMLLARHHRPRPIAFSLLLKRRRQKKVVMLGEGSDDTRVVSRDFSAYPCHCHSFFATKSTRRFLHTKNSGARTSGLYSLPELQHPSDFVREAHEAMERCDAIRDSLGQEEGNNPTAPQHSNRTLFRLDAVSQHVCNVIDAAELCRSTHASAAWRDAAERAFGIISDYIAQLNTDPRLYNSLIRVLEEHNNNNKLSPEQARFAQLLRAEFERDGIHLPEDERQRARELNNTVTELETQFSRNIMMGPAREFQADAEAINNVLPEAVQRAHGIAPDECNAADNKLLVPDSSQICLTLLQYSTCPELRESVYRAHHTGVAANRAVLHQLVQARHALSQALNHDDHHNSNNAYASHADRVLRDKMAGTPQKVASFLNKARQENAPQFRRDMEMIQQAKKHVEPDSGSMVQPWDVSFYRALLQAQQSSSSGIDDPQRMAEYFYLPHVLESLQHIVQQLFGIQMVPVAHLSEAEQWDIDFDRTNRDENGKKEHNASTIQRFDFNDENGEHLGKLYLDLHPRQSKYGHAAHFTIRCGCAVLQDNGCSEEDIALDNDPNLSYQTPIVALVCNIPEGSINLSHPQVETIFHEFGHALHSLLSRTRFQHLAGTRGPLDFVETPSHWMEHYCWDAYFLKHHLAINADGESMPDELIARLLASKHEFAAIERHNQILYATFDQALFGCNAPSLLTLSTDSDGEDSVMKLFGQLHGDFGIPHVKGTHWYTRFGHLVTYGASYYSYLYAQIFARDIWRTHFHQHEHNNKHHCLSPDAGRRLWRDVLAHGGSRDPGRMLTDLLGRSPDDGSKEVR